eukprot:1157004-Pelagomonas_calceolata.AAC.3
MPAQVHCSVGFRTKWSALCRAAFENSSLLGNACAGLHCAVLHLRTTASWTMPAQSQHCVCSSCSAARKAWDT